MPDAMNNGCSYKPSIHGALIAGVVPQPRPVRLPVQTHPRQRQDTR